MAEDDIASRDNVSFERLASEVESLRAQIQESDSALDGALKNIELNLSNLSREINLIKDRLASTALAAALIERLAARVEDL
jgi:archaellum component FlaC